MSGYRRQYGVVSLAVMLTAALGGCATYEQCGINGCAGDAQVTAAVKSRLDQHPDLGPAGAIEVKTLDHVVYLDGFVATGLERRTAESVAESAPGVTRRGFGRRLSLTGVRLRGPLWSGVLLEQRADLGIIVRHQYMRMKGLRHGGHTSM